VTMIARDVSVCVDPELVRGQYFTSCS